jgi:hypothetical protein
LTATWIEFNIHDRCAIRVAANAPTAPLLSEMLEPFRASGLRHHDITITGTFDPMEEAAYGSVLYRYTEQSLFLNAMKVQIALDACGFKLNGRRELLVSALPLIDNVVVRRGTATIHAATVSYRNHGICMPAWGETGKTSTIAKLLKIDGMAFMGDDWAFLSDDQQLLGYAKPMFIKPHHRLIYPHLFSHKTKPLVPSRLNASLGKVATAVHPFITQYPRIASFSRRWSPEHLKVTPREAFPHASFATAAELAAVVFLERSDGKQTTLQEKDRSWMVSRMIGNFHAEIGPHSQEVMTALAATGLVPLEKFFADKKAVLERALADKPTYLLQVPKALLPDQASDQFVEHLQKVFARCGIG